jgi:hypothetical protein
MSDKPTANDIGELIEFCVLESDRCFACSYREKSERAVMIANAVAERMARMEVLLRRSVNLLGASFCKDDIEALLKEIR